MTYDFSHYAARSSDLIQKDPTFQKMNEIGVILNIDFDSVF